MRALLHIPTAAIICLITPLQVSAQAALSLPEALRLGEQHVPLLVRARNDELLARAKREAAAMILPQNPYATFMGGYRRETTSNPTATGFQYQVHVEQMLEIAGQRRTRLDSVAAQIGVAQANRDHAKTLSRALVHSTYLMASLAEQRVQVSEQRERIAERLLESARVRKEVGAASEIDLNLARIEAGRVAGDRVDAETKREELFGELRLLCGITAGTPMQLSSRTDLSLLQNVPQDVKQLIALAEAQRSDYRALSKQQHANDRERARLERERVPNPVLALDLQRDLPGQDFYGGTIGVYLPVWNRNQGPLSQLRAQEASRQREASLLTARIHSEVTVAQRKLMMLRKAVETFEKGVLPPAEHNLELLTRGFQAGKFDLFRVIVASRELAETRLRHLDLLGELWSAAIDLERAVGAPILSGGL